MKEVIAEARKSRKTCKSEHASSVKTNAKVISVANAAPLPADNRTALLHANANAGKKVAPSTRKAPPLKLPPPKKVKFTQLSKYLEIKSSLVSITFFAVTSAK